MADLAPFVPNELHFIERVGERYYGVTLTFATDRPALIEHRWEAHEHRRWTLARPPLPGGDQRVKAKYKRGRRDGDAVLYHWTGAFHDIEVTVRSTTPSTSQEVDLSPPLQAPGQERCSWRWHSGHWQSSRDGHTWESVPDKRNPFAPTGAKHQGRPDGVGRRAGQMGERNKG